MQLRSFVEWPTEMPRKPRQATRPAKTPTTASLAKVATGIEGFDEITGGGPPQGRPTLVCGGPGCGKTLFALQFLIHGAAVGENGVFVSFEETEQDHADSRRFADLDPTECRRGGDCVQWSP